MSKYHADAVRRVIIQIRLEAQSLGGADWDRPEHLRAAARTVKLRSKGLCLAAMEQIGSWPSSEKELAALQQVWP